MGDRANVFVRTDEQNPQIGVYLYTHNGGTDLPATVQRALAKRWRWNDPAYLARIIFCEMVKGHDDRETGFGIATYSPDGRERILYVDPFKQTIGCTCENAREGADLSIRLPCKPTWTFEKFVALNLDEKSGWRTNEYGDRL